MGSASTARPLSRRAFAVLVLGQLALALVLTYPVALRLGHGELWGGGPDSYQSLWNLWWTKTALASGTERWFYTDWIYQPVGMPLPLHTFCPLMAVLGVPLGAFLAPEDCHALLMLATYVAAGIAAFLLVYDWLGRTGPACLGALVFAYSPYHAVHALGHLNLASIEFFPLYFLALGRVLGGVPGHLGANGERVRKWWAAGAGVAWALAVWVDFQYALFLALFTPLFWLGLRRSAPLESEASPSSTPTSSLPTNAGRLLAWGVLAAVVVVAPLAWAIGAELLRYGMPARALGSELYSLDLVSAALPSPLNPLTGPLLAPFLARFPDWYDAVERVGYVGIVPLLCALFAFRGRPHMRVWRWLLLGGWIFSLGPSLRVLGYDTHVPLPGALFAHLPVLDQFRAPARFQVVTFLALALLVPSVLAGLAERISIRRRTFAGGVLFAFVALDLSAPPTILAPIRVPASVRWLAAQPDHSTVHLLALDDTPYVWMYYQSLCAKKLLVGRAARLYLERERAAEDEQARLSALLQPDAQGNYRAPAEVRRLFQEAGVGYVLVPLATFAGNARLTKLYQQMVAHVFPEGPSFEDERHAVFALAGDGPQR